MQGYNLEDTIVAFATPEQTSALGIVRLSGSSSWRIVTTLMQMGADEPRPRYAYVTQLLLDQVEERTSVETDLPTEGAVVIFWLGPKSYTGEDMVEISVHGNPLILRSIIKACIREGAREAEPGEFTYRAYLNDKLDLSQAEAVNQVITASSKRSLDLARSSLLGAQSGQIQKWIDMLNTLLSQIEVIHDYASDDLDSSLDEETIMNPESIGVTLTQMGDQLSDVLKHSRQLSRLNNGITIAILGEPNVGKSTLFNALLGHQRALTAPKPGTTRDYLTETINADGLKLTLVDTAGIRETKEEIEAAGVRASTDWRESADIVLWVLTASDPPKLVPPEAIGLDPIIVYTKSDLLDSAVPANNDYSFWVSGTTGDGISELFKGIRKRLDHELPQTLVMFTKRQAALIEKAIDYLSQANQAIGVQLPLDMVAEDIYRAKEQLHGVFEQEDKQAVIDQIFSNFCVGK